MHSCSYLLINLKKGRDLEKLTFPFYFQTTIMVEYQIFKLNDVSSTLLCQLARTPVTSPELYAQAHIYLKALKVLLFVASKTQF